MITVKKIADLAGVSSDTVRHYTRIGLLRPTRSVANNYKSFSLEDVKRLKFIRRSQQLGFSLKEVTQLLCDAELGKSPCPKARDIIHHKIIDNKKAINDLIKLQAKLEKALVQWSKMPNKVPDGETICHLVEHWDNG